jgi:methylglutaconyl-CoA hydratase
MTASTVLLDIRPVRSDRDDCIAVISLNRPETANALNSDMIRELTEAALKLRRQAKLRAVILRGQAKNFCAGADLAWMKDAAKLNYEENIEDTHRLQRMFESLNGLPVPLIVAVHGNVFGGAVGLAAIGDIVIVADGTKFCLSEVKLGLLPAVILPYLGRRMNPGTIRRLALTARIFGADEALKNGLADIKSSPEELDSVIRSELALILQASPDAQKRFKELYALNRQENFPQSESCAESIASARTSSSGQAGLQAFFSKSQPDWKIDLPQDWKLR